MCGINFLLEIPRHYPGSQVEGEAGHQLCTEHPRGLGSEPVFRVLDGGESNPPENMPFKRVRRGLGEAVEPWRYPGTSQALQALLGP